MSDTASHGNGGIGFFGLLQVVFITLKVTGLIDWSWWMVFTPTLAAVALFISVITFTILAMAVVDWWCK